MERLEDDPEHDLAESKIGARVGKVGVGKAYQRGSSCTCLQDIISGFIECMLILWNLLYESLTVGPPISKTQIFESTTTHEHSDYILYRHPKAS